MRITIKRISYLTEQEKQWESYNKKNIAEIASYNTTITHVDIK
jgi:hypothetical protein